MKGNTILKWGMALIALIVISAVLPSCKSKKKCPDFTKVDGKVKTDRHGLVKKKRRKAPFSEQNY